MALLIPQADPPARRACGHPGAMLAWVGLSLVLLWPVQADRALPEYQVKAAFLYNFAVLTQWPAESFASEDAALVIGVLGQDPFGELLEQTLADKRVGERPLRTARYANLAEIGTCHILFISSEQATLLPEILAGLEGRHVLTVAETESFARHGGMLQMSKRADNTIGLRVNLAAVEAAGLKLSSKLLRLAIILPSTKMAEAR